MPSCNESNRNTQEISSLQTDTGSNNIIDSDEAMSNTKKEFHEDPYKYAKDDFIRIDNFDSIKYDDYLNNDIFSEETNLYLKKNILDAIAYTYNLKDASMEYINIDKQASEKWFLEDGYHEDGWNIENEIEKFRKSHVDKNYVTHIDANFMLKPKNILEETEIIIISIPVIDAETPTFIGGVRVTYDFYFKLIDGEYKIIGIAAEA